MSSQENTIMRLQPGALQQRTPMRSRCDVTMDAIKSYILRERLQPGDLLPTEIELCEAVGASRSSVREAVRKLEGLNIVNVEHGRGRSSVRCPSTPWWRRWRFVRWCRWARTSTI